MFHRLEPKLQHPKVRTSYRMGLGPADGREVVSLSETHEKVADPKRLVAQDVEPIEEPTKAANPAR
jgi:hypothetical protein